MKKLNLIILLLILVQYSYSQQFTENTAIGLQGIIYGENAWLNIDNNGKDELLVSGYDSDYNNTSGLYSYQSENIGLTTTNIEAFSNANISTLDYNNDGYMDFIINGYNSNDEEDVILYINDTNGSFVEQNLSIPGTSAGKMQTADLNNDGLSDVIITGVDANYNYIAKLYLQNNEGAFIETTAPFFGNSYGSILTFDANNDGNLDVLLTGFSNNYEPETKLYINNGNAVFTEKTNTGIANIYFSSLSAADYDNDGDKDVLISGFNSSYIPYTALYNNDGNENFILNTEINLMQLYWGSTSFVDYDNDGDLDIFISGADVNTLPFAKFYKNENEEFIEDLEAEIGISGTYISSVNWSDYDNDGDLDFVLSGLDGNNDAITKVYDNQQESLSVQDFTSNIEFTIYPNPTTNKIVNLVFDESKLLASSKVSIYSTIGQKVFETDLNNNTSNKALYLNTLNEGIYLLKISSGDFTKTKKIILK